MIVDLKNLIEMMHKGYKIRIYFNGKWFILSEMSREWIEENLPDGLYSLLTDGEIYYASYIG